MRYDVVLLREQWEIKMTNICVELVAGELSSAVFFLFISIVRLLCLRTVFDIQAQLPRAAKGNDIA